MKRNRSFSGKLTNQEIFARIIPQTHVEGVVTEIIQTVRKEGDSALYAYAQKFDGAQLDTLGVTAGGNGGIVQFPADPGDVFGNGHKIPLSVLKEMK